MVGTPLPMNTWGLPLDAEAILVCVGGYVEVLGNPFTVNVIEVSKLRPELD
jgi:hypothetical protein